MVMVMEYGNVDADNVCPMATLLEMVMVTVMYYPTENDNAVPAACDCDTLDKGLMAHFNHHPNCWMMDGGWMMRTC